MTDPALQRDIGRMEAEIKNLNITVGALTTSVAALTSETRQIKETMAEARGGWRTLVWLAGASGALGSALTYVANLFMSKPG